MSSDVVYTAIRAMLDPSWTACPLRWENETFTPADPADKTVVFAAVEISGSSYEQASIGAAPAAANLWREEGAVWFHVFVPAGTGSTKARQVAKQLCDVFRGQTVQTTLGALRFRRSSIGTGERATEDGNWWRVSAEVEWQADE